MKKVLSVLFLAGAFSLVVKAQDILPQEVLNFFEENGTIRLETEELNAAADTLVTVVHRKDDVVWSRVVYRVIDMRFKQNYQLYFPTNPDDYQYRSLWRIIMQAVKDGTNIYSPSLEKLKPEFSDSTLIPRNKVSDYFLVGTIQDMDRDDPDTYLMPYDEATNTLSFNFTRYEPYIRNQVKFLIQEVIFFNKHTSRMHRQILSIAPMQPDLASGVEPMEFLRNSVRFWVLWKDLRPYLAKTYMIPLGNETKRMTYEAFFQQRLYTSYLVGEGNIYNRMILDYATDETAAKKEQERIETEILNFEQDLWEY